MQAFIKTAATIYKKIQDGVFDVSNEVSPYYSLPSLLFFSQLTRWDSVLVLVFVFQKISCVVSCVGEM